jgi:hypothetical protein
MFAYFNVAAMLLKDTFAEDDENDSPILNRLEARKGFEERQTGEPACNARRGQIVL